MDDETPITSSNEFTTQQPPISSQELEARQRRMVIGLVIIGIILVVLILASTIYLMQPTTNTEKIRDVFISGWHWNQCC